MVSETQPSYALSCHVPNMYRNRDDQWVSSIRIYVFVRHMLTDVFSFDSSMMNGLQAVDSWESCKTTCSATVSGRGLTPC